MILLGTIRIAGEAIEVYHKPTQKHAGEFDPQNHRIVIRERSLKTAIHELGHALVWAHCLGDLFAKGGEEALCGALEISWPEAQHRLEALFEDPEE